MPNTLNLIINLRKAVKDFSGDVVACVARNKNYTASLFDLSFLKKETVPELARL